MALRSPPLLSILLFAATVTVGAGHAAELGEAQVLSYLGQALVANVELTSLDDPNSPVRVRLANPDVYRGANIAMPPVLSSLNITMTRQGGRQFLHLTSLKPVESRHLHVYLELLDGGQRSVRLVTLWLTPDPNPAPPPPVPEAVPEAPKAQILPAPPLPAPARKPAPLARPAAALQAGEEYVEAAPAPRKAALKPLPVAKAVQARKPVVPPPRPAPATHADAPSCAPQAPTGQLDACVALGEKNAALRHDLVRLEEKVKTLQDAAGTAPVPAAKEAPQDAPKGAPRIHRKPKNAEPPAEDTPWLMIGAAIAAVSALVGLVLALLIRRKRARFGKIPAAQKPARMPKAANAPAPAEGEPKPNFMAAVKARLMPNRGKAAAPAAGAAVTDNEALPTEVISRPD
jgi:pilus assembly protein FimV